ncbi:MAG: glycosyltransferase, partial [Gammaproteobacteria bacterium]|nr:glycosyltransferase [Gammaproteobacteria bacterium]
MKYVVVIPARKDEEQTIKDTIKSVMEQTISPQCVLVMDDGSTDNTPNILTILKSRYPALKHHSVPSENSYSTGR